MLTMATTFAAMMPTISAMVLPPPAGYHGGNSGNCTEDCFGDHNLSRDVCGVLHVRVANHGIYHDLFTLVVRCQLQCLLGDDACIGDDARRDARTYLALGTDVRRRFSHYASRPRAPPQSSITTSSR